MKFSPTTVVMMLLCGQHFARRACAFFAPRTVSSCRSTNVHNTGGCAVLFSTTTTKEETSSAQQQQSIPDMEEIVSLCKRRGFIFPSSEIYNGYAGFFDYGPLGAELKKNLKDAWWRHFVTQREDVIGLDSSIIHNPTTWQSSGMCTDIISTDLE